MDLKSKTLNGLAWTFVSRGLVQVTQYIISVSIARLLLPGDFGLVAMVTVFTGLASLFLDFGISAAIVQRAELTAEQSRSAFFATLGLGATLWAVMTMLAPAVATFYHRPELIALTRALSLLFLFNSVAIVPRALLQREFRLGRLALNDTIAAVAGSVLNLVMALRGAHVWSLVVGTLATSFIGASLAWGSVSWLRPLPQMSHLRPLLGISLNLLGFNFVNYWARNADNLIIGKMLGERELGIYARAYSLMMLAIAQITATVSSAMIPALAAVQTDKKRSQRLYLRAVAMTAFFAFPLMVGMSASANTFMRVVYGSKWEEAIPIVRIFGFIGALQAILSPVGWIFVSQGRTDRMFRLGAATASVIVVGFAVGAMFHSAQAVAVSYLVTNILICLPEMKVAGDCIDLALGDMLKSLEKSAFSAAVMAVPVWVLDHRGQPRPAWLALEIVVGAATFLACSWLIRDPALADARTLAADRWTRVKARLLPPQTFGGD